jgi:group I intron endonuclease
MKNKHNNQEMQQCGIYTIKNMINNKVYVGSTRTNFKKRLYQHLLDLEKEKHCNKHLQNSYFKYGKDNFQFEIQEIIESDMLISYFLAKEQFYIDYYSSSISSYGYNIISYSDIEIDSFILKNMISEEAINYLKDIFIERGCIKEDIDIIFENDNVENIIDLFDELFSEGNEESYLFRQFIIININHKEKNMWQYPTLYINKCIETNCKYCDIHNNYCKYQESYFKDMEIDDISNCIYSYEYETELDALFDEHIYYHRKKYLKDIDKED